MLLVILVSVNNNYSFKARYAILLQTLEKSVERPRQITEKLWHLAA